MSSPTTSWICDTCDRQIEQADHGWVEWIDLSEAAGDAPRGRDIRIVHHAPHSPRSNGCQFESNQEHARDRGVIADAALPEFQGSDGLMRLLEMVAEERLPTAELLEVIKRIHIPGYEHARRHFARALREGVIEQNVALGYWWQSDIDLVLAFARPAE